MSRHQTRTIHDCKQPFREIIKKIDEELCGSAVDHFVVIMDDTQIPLLPRQPQDIDVERVEYAFEAGSVVLRSNEFVDLEHRLDVLAAYRFLDKVRPGIYRINDKLKSELTSIEAEI